ncbi:hypothetical protein [Vibrio sp. S9_S30]|uniref:hypothetical protein n=1 Tax=Vibrio sp. S9_S30 TaxID=2720226 RepID=UPI001EEEDA16|nr:hypothetical protein [Vibrio sp. S9_S30]
MFVVKRNDGILIVINPVELTTQLQLSLSEIGVVGQVITSSPSYHYALSEWWLAYSEAYFLATPTVIQTRSDLTFDDALSSSTHPFLKGEIFQTSIRGSNQPRKVLFCDPISRTLLLPDLLVMSQPHLPLSQRLYAAINGASYAMSLPIWNRVQINKTSLLRASVQEVLTWPVEHILSSTGLIQRGEAKEAIYHAYRWAF